jgi:site-specific DNA-adenine methylase
MNKTEDGIPFMGSKRKLADKIIFHNMEHNPKCGYFYDLFGGGGAISFQALQQKRIKKVVYNELNTGVCELIKKIQKDGVTDDFYNWVSREDFNRYKDNSDWRGGLVKTCWSFGNDQKSYIYGKHVEQYKHDYHAVVVDGVDKLASMSRYCEQYVKEKHGIGHKCFLVMPEGKTIQERRLHLRKQLVGFERQCKIAKSHGTGPLDHLQHLERLQKLKQLQHMINLEQLERLQHLEQLQQLERLERLGHLQQLQHLEVLNMDYRYVAIDPPVDKTIIYLDPPYEKTEGYQCKMDHEELKKYIATSPFKIYMSGYECKYMQEVASYEHRSQLSATQNNKVSEKLYCNRAEASNGLLF